MQLVMFRADVLSCVSKDMVYQYKNIFVNSRHRPIYNIVKDDYSITISKEPLEVKMKKNCFQDKKQLSQRECWNHGKDTQILLRLSI